MSLRDRIIIRDNGCDLGIEDRIIYGNKEDVTRNVMHASDSKENAQIELNRFNKYRKVLTKRK